MDLQSADCNAACAFAARPRSCDHSSSVSTPRSCLAMPPRRRPIEELRSRQLDLDTALLLRCSASPLVARARDAAPWIELGHRWRVAALARRGQSATPPRRRPDKDIWPRQLGVPLPLLPHCSTSPLGARPRDAALWMRQSPDKEMRPQRPWRPWRPDRPQLLTASISLSFAGTLFSALESGRPDSWKIRSTLFWALVFKIRGILKNQSDSRK